MLYYIINSAPILCCCTVRHTAKVLSLFSAVKTSAVY
jgi:hypothetical protein